MCTVASVLIFKILLVSIRGFQKFQTVRFEYCTWFQRGFNGFREVSMVSDRFQWLLRGFSCFLEVSMVSERHQ